MKNILLIIRFVLITCAYQLSFAQPYLQIHQIGGGYGDATLIIAVDESKVEGKQWDTCVVLIDGQSSSEAGAEVWRYSRDTLQVLFPDRKIIDYIIISHLHTDHFRGVQTFIDSAKDASWKIGYIGLPSQITYNPGGADDDCYLEEVSTTNKSQATDFLSYITTSGIPNGVIQLKNDLFYKSNIANMTMECIVAGGSTINPENGNPYSFLKDGMVKNENDLSYGWLISFEGFHYITMGDLGGPSSSYSDGETYATQYLVGRFKNDNYHLCAYKVGHHGSAKSTASDFVEKNNPTFPVIPARLKSYNSTALPTSEVINSFLSNGTTTGLNTSTNGKIYYTFIPQNAGVQSSYWTKDNFLYYQDIVLKIYAHTGMDTGDPEEDYKVREITIISAPKDSDYQYHNKNSAVPSTTIGTYNCTKGHNW
jgi:beta-lactamase superfamily II metal-dependent hydrolase